MAMCERGVPAAAGVVTVTPAFPMSDKIARLESSRAHRRIAIRPTAARRLNLGALHAEFTELTVRFEADHGALWCMFNHTERPCFTPRLLDQIRSLQTRIEQGMAASIDAGDKPLRAVIWTSAVPGIWNLGGDLALFTRLIRDGAEAELRRYAYTCVDAVYHNLTKGHLPFLTIAMVHGDALGGGFETVLSCDVVIAERGAKFGLPEVLFNLFPGMGAYSLLCRRLDGARAQKLMLSGRIYEAEELEAMGLVDLVVEPGEGRDAVRDYLERNRRRHDTLCALSRVRQHCQPVSYEELIAVTGLWVETALRLDQADLRRMEHLVRAQQRRYERTRTEQTRTEQSMPISAVG
jgi:DSF synthase